MNIYNQTVPYFYIIRNKETRVMYAGSRWAKGCHPAEFMLKNSYQTSSSKVHQIIKEFGIDIFEILRIDTYCDGLHPYDYETLFLQTNDCANSSSWYNKHNNEGKMSFGTEYFKIISKELFGTYYPAQSKIIKSKIRKTNIEKHGYENVFQNEEIKNQIKQTNLNKYGVEYTAQVPEFKEKRKETCLKQYGVDNPGKRTKLCEFCNQIKNINHIRQCKLNPNRNVWDRSKDKHPKAKTYNIETPEKEIISIKGNIINFCESNGFSWGKLKRGTVIGWKLLP